MNDDLVLKPYDVNSKIIEDENGTVVGFLLRMSNDLWGVYDTDDKKLTAEVFPRTPAAFKAFKEVYVA